MTTRPSAVTVLDNDGPGDWELVRAAQAGDRTAMGTLYERHVDAVYGYIYWRMGRNADLAEQFTSEVFCRFLKRIDTVSDVGKDFAAWLITIAKHLVYDYTKSARYRLDRSYADVPERRSHEDPEALIVARMTREFSARNLTRCVRQLSLDQQEVIGLRFYVGLSVTETARVMNRQEGAVKALQHRAVLRLARLLPDDAPSWIMSDVGVTS